MVGCWGLHFCSMHYLYPLFFPQNTVLIVQKLFGCPLLLWVWGVKSMASMREDIMRVLGGPLHVLTCILLQIVLVLEQFSKQYNSIFKFRIKNFVNIQY
jgi:hypothetical protein